MRKDENEVERLVRLGIALANDLIDEQGKTWIHLAEDQFEGVEHNLILGAVAMLLKMELDDDDVVSILKIATSSSFSIIFGDPLTLQDWKDVDN